ncbi:hypothetical protein [Streptomyces cellulosae]|uniref:Transposase n=1 Tax=Streptomyces cellulosae TaxID=1968 RepID=A0ABW7YC49_STRCE
MSDLPPAERLAKLRTLEAWLGWQLRDTQRKIEQVEQQTRATGGYVTDGFVSGNGHRLSTSLNTTCRSQVREISLRSDTTPAM